jgi:hypothetical protein
MAATSVTPQDVGRRCAFGVSSASAVVEQIAQEGRGAGRGVPARARPSARPRGPAGASECARMGGIASSRARAPGNPRRVQPGPRSFHRAGKANSFHCRSTRRRLPSDRPQHRKPATQPGRIEAGAGDAAQQPGEELRTSNDRARRYAGRPISNGPPIGGPFASQRLLASMLPSAARSLGVAAWIAEPTPALVVIVVVTTTRATRTATIIVIVVAAA